MVDQKLTDLLASMVRTNAARGPLPSMQEVSGLSAAILSRTPVQNPYKSTAEINKNKPGPSVVNRVLDVMSRPLYGTLTPIRDAITPEDEGRNVLEGIWAGVSGKEKTTGRDIVEATPYSKLSGPERFAVGLGIDIIADPLTYVGGIGLASKLGKGAKTSTEALRSVEQGAGATAQDLAADISRRAATQSEQLIPKPASTPVAESVSNARPMPPGPQLALPPGPSATAQIPTIEPDFVSVPQKQPTNLLERLLYERSGGADIRVPNLNKTGDVERDLAGLDPEMSSLFRQNIEKIRREGLTKADEIGEPTLQLDLRQSTPMKALSDKPFSYIPQVKALQAEIAATKSPIKKNQLRIDLEKMVAGVKPADILGEARVSPAPFPELTINQRWIDTARKAARDFLSYNRMRNINHVGQTNLYNKVLHAAGKVRKDRRQFHVLQMLRIAEEEVLAAGRSLTDAEGISVRLSDVANMSGGARTLTPKLVDDFRKARPSQRVEDLKSYITPQVVTEILDPVVKTGAELAEQVKALPPSQTVEVGTDISKELAKIARKAGASSREAAAAKSFVDELFSVDRDKLYGVIEQEARNLVRQSMSGRVDAPALSEVSQEVYKSLGANPKILGRDLTQSRVTEAFMTKFATWWGAKDLKPFSREYIDTARNVAAAFSETLKPIVARTTPTQRASAWPVAVGKRSASNPQEQALADQFKYLVERLMGTHGITSNAESVVLRSGTLLKELNDELPEALKLTEKKGTDSLGRKFDYSNGNWMHSWKEWDVKEPAEALYQLTRSLQMVTRKNAMWDDAAARWGMPVKKAEFQHPVKGIPRLAGMYFPKQMADQLATLQNQLNRDVFKAPHKAIRLFDQVQRMWKTGVTIYSPSHHIRNLNGDIYLSALDGVVSPKPYALATRVMHAFPTRNKSLESAFNIMDPKLRERALRSRPGDVLLTTKRGDRLTAEQIYQAAESQGLFVRAMHAEDLVGDSAPAFGTFGAGFRPLGGKAHDIATATSELRDHWARLAHFIDVLSKSGQPLRVAIEQAGRRVKKFHPDGMDLTGFEQNILRRAIPFYSWMRKATPLVIEGAIMRPHISLAFPKAMANIQAATGIESNGPGDPFPMDQMFPDWLKEKGIGPVLQPGSGLGRDENWRGEAPGYTIINPTNPFTDQVSQLGSPTKTLLSSLTPGARIPIELLTGQTSLGIPLENVEGGTPGYLAQQIPAVGIGARLTGATRDNEPWNPEQLINWLTSAGITGTGPYQGQAQTELRELLAQMAKQNRGDYR